jgi:hypothetical protein
MHRSSKTDAGQATQAAVRARSQKNTRNQSFGAAGVCVSIITGEIIKAQPIKFTSKRKARRSKRTRKSLIFQGSIS